MTAEELERELAELREEDAAIRTQVDEAAQARDAATKAYKASKRRRPRIIRGGVPIYEPAWLAEDEAHEAMLVEQEESIQAANRRSRELGEAIEDRRGLLRQARRREEARVGVTAVAPLEVEVEAARVAYQSAAEELAAIPAELEEAHRTGEVESIVGVQCRARDVALYVEAGRTKLLSAEHRHAIAAAASLAGEAEAAEEALNTAAEELAKAKASHEKAIAAFRCLAADQQKARGRVHRLAQELEAHLSSQRVA